MRIPYIIIAALAVSVISYGCSDTGTGEPNQSLDYPNSGLLVEARWLQDNLDLEELRIIDMRPKGYQKDHIPGAVSIKGAGKLVDEEHEVSNFLVSADKFGTMMGERGIGSDHTVVIYDEGNSLAASRLFYALERYGHTNVKILNGGYASWTANEGELSEDLPVLESTDFKVKAQDALVCDIEYIQQNTGNENVIFYDARSLEEFEGTDVRADQGGHIPGAVHLEWSESLQDGDIPYFKSVADLSLMLADKGITPDKEIIPHCQSNVRGAHVYFMLRLMGYDSIRPYEGSWGEYGNTEGVPIQN